MGGKALGRGQTGKRRLCETCASRLRTICTSWDSPKSRQADKVGELKIIHESERRSRKPNSNVKVIVDLCRPVITFPGLWNCCDANGQSPCRLETFNNSNNSLTNYFRRRVQSRGRRLRNLQRKRRLLPSHATRLPLCVLKLYVEVSIVRQIKTRPDVYTA